MFSLSFSFVLALILLTCGIWESFKLRFMPWRLLPLFISGLFHKKNRKAAPGRISPFKALTASLAATIGTGNIAGVATAISLGGPGSVFWLWVSGLFGMAVKYSEIVLGVAFRRQERGEYYGGPMYYLKETPFPGLASAYALLGAVSAFGIGNLVQSNTVAQVSELAFSLPPIGVGIAASIIVGLVLIGGARRVTGFTEKLVPLMAGLYIAASLIIIYKYFSYIPGIIEEILAAAFSGRAAVGGFAGAGIKEAFNFGIVRGIFSNEAGLGSAAIAHSLAETDNPVRQGMWGLLEVFIDTHCICTLTALVILVTGQWTEYNRGAAITAAAFEQGLPGLGDKIISLGLILFAFSTLVAWALYGERCIHFLAGSGWVTLYRVIWCLLIVWGARADILFVWKVSDLLNGLVVIPNLIGLAVLSPVVLKLTAVFGKRLY